MFAKAPSVTYGQIIAAHAGQIAHNAMWNARCDMAFSGWLFNDPILAFYGLGSHWRNRDDFLRAYDKANQNYRLVHGFDPHNLIDIWHLIREYSHIPTLEELSAKTADLSSRIDSAKAKHGVM